MIDDSKRTELDRVLRIEEKIRRFSRESVKRLRDYCNGILDTAPVYLIPHSQPAFSFRLPSGIGEPVPWLDLEDPPFFNRQRTLLELLTDCYKNFEGKLKPTAAVIATSPGYGKTRLLLEWAIRVFHSPDVMHAFIENEAITDAEPKSFQELVQAIKHETGTSLSPKRLRMRFLCALHETLKKSLIISASVDDVDIPQISNSHDAAAVDKAADLLCRSIVIRNICLRFKGQHTVYQKQITIPTFWNPAEDEDTKWLVENDLLKQHPKAPFRVLYSLLLLFIELVESTSTDYQPIGSRKPGFQMLLINIDEAQKILEVPAMERVLAYKVMEKFYDFSTIATGEPTKFKVHVLMVGLFTSHLSKLQDVTKIITNISLPLTPLVSEEYCSTICKLIVDGELTNAALDIVQVLWKKCLGIPRAIQVLHNTLLQFKGVLQQPNINAATRNQITAEFTKRATVYFAQTISLNHNDFGLTKQDWEKKLLELSLCLPRQQKEPFGNTTYDQLEGRGIIFPMQFGEMVSGSATRNYTVPFLFYGPKLTELSVDLWNLKNTSSMLKHVHLTIASVIGGDGSQATTVQQGEVLEHACAASIWARYQLQAVDQYQYVKMTDLVADWKYGNHYVRFTGVLSAERQITSYARDLKDKKKQQEAEHWTFGSMLETLKNTQAIIINKANSQFADVLVPVMTLNEADLGILQNLAEEVKTQKKKMSELMEAESKFICYLLIQCKNVRPESEDIQPAKILKDFKAHKLLQFMDQGHIFMLLAPNLPQKTLSERFQSTEHPNIFEKYEKNIVETKGDEWLSKLFLLSYGNKSKQATGQKRKADTQQNIDPTATKKPKQK